MTSIIQMPSGSLFLRRAGLSWAEGEPQGVGRFSTQLVSVCRLGLQPCNLPEKRRKYLSVRAF